MAIDVIHDFIFVGSKFVKSFGQNGGLDGHARDRVSFLVKLLTDPEDAVKKIKVTAKSAKKGADMSKKSERKMKEKVVEDKTFGLKNKSKSTKA